MDSSRRTKKGRLSISMIEKAAQQQLKSDEDTFENRNVKITKIKPTKASSHKNSINHEQQHNQRQNCVVESETHSEALKSTVSEFCPICQVPLALMKISTELHISNCSMDSEWLPNCPDGTTCLNTNIFHYRDFNHQTLAAWRCSADYVPPVNNTTPPRSIGKKRLSVSPMTPASRKKLTKISKREEEEKVDDPEEVAAAPFRKALFTTDNASTSGSKQSKNVEENVGPPEAVSTSETMGWIKEEVLSSSQNENQDKMVLDIDEDYISELVDKYVQEKSPEEKKLKPLKCDVVVEYNANADETPKSENPIVSRQSSCIASCLSTSNHDELQAVCTISIRAPGRNKQAAAAQSPVHVNLLLNESGWEAVQVDGTQSASLTKMDMSVCKCSHVMTLKCSVTDPEIVGQSVNQRDDDVFEHKYSAVLHELGLKKSKMESANVEPAYGTKTSSHEKVNGLKSKNSQLSIKSFFQCDKDPPKKNVLQPVFQPDPVKKSAFSKVKDKSVKKPPLPKTPVVLIAGNNTSRPLTPVELLSDAPVRIARPNKGRSWGNSTTPVPQYKRITDTAFTVDAFKWGNISGVMAYFLSHFHSDHYMGLTKKFEQPIYCSKITANLIRLKMNLDPKFIHVLEVGVPRVICNVEVEAFDANHCPGSFMFLFQLSDGRKVLHVGDFRACPSMELIPSLRGVDVLYLDTTYCDPAYDFPPQEEIVKQVVSYAKMHLQKNPKTLFVSGSYTIGKEKVFLGLAEALDCRVWARKDKTKVLSCLEDEIISKRLCDDPTQAQVHVLYMNQINFQFLEVALKDVSSTFSHLVAFQPTGWTTSKVGSTSTFKKSSQGNITIYAVPYSEHSSFSELRRFVRFVRPKRIQVTVNLSKQKEYQKHFQQWLGSSGGEQRSLKTFF